MAVDNRSNRIKDYEEVRFKINLAYIIRLIDSFPINEPDFFQESWPSAIYDSSSSQERVGVTGLRPLPSSTSALQ